MESRKPVRCENKVETIAGLNYLKAMSKAAALTDHEAHYKARAEHYLAETQKILRQLASERQRMARRPHSQTSLVKQVKEILHGK